MKLHIINECKYFNNLLSKKGYFLKNFETHLPEKGFFENLIASLKWAFKKITCRPHIHILIIYIPLPLTN